jgi:hypothetical protein
MTEEEWLASASPEALLDFIEADVSERKLVLFACACWRRLWHLIPAGPARLPVEMAEAFAEGFIEREQWESAQAHWRMNVGGRALQRSLGARINEALVYMGVGPVTGAVQARAASQAARSAAEWAGPWAVEAEARSQCALLRDLAGNPFRPVACNPVWVQWNDGCTVRLAREIYDDRRFDDLPILGDALEDAGCTDEAVLAHARGEGPHTRGCWLVDLLLNKGRTDGRGDLAVL